MAGVRQQEGEFPLSEFVESDGRMVAIPASALREFSGARI